MYCIYHICIYAYTYIYIYIQNVECFYLFEQMLKTLMAIKINKSNIGGYFLILECRYYKKWRSIFEY